MQSLKNQPYQNREEYKNQFTNPTKYYDQPEGIPNEKVKLTQMSLDIQNQLGFLEITYVPPRRCCNQKKLAFKIFVDEIEVGYLSFGQRTVFPVNPGLHTIVAKPSGLGSFFAKLAGIGALGQLTLSFKSGENTSLMLKWAEQCCSAYPFLESASYTKEEPKYFPKKAP